MRKAPAKAHRNIARLVTCGHAFHDPLPGIEQDHIDVGAERGIIERGFTNETADTKAVRDRFDMRRGDLPGVI